ASLGAMYLGEYHEAIGVMFFYKIGEILEEKAVLKSKKSISSLLELRPETAFQKQSNGSFQEVPTASLHIGDIIQVKEGERIPIDAEIIRGESYLDISALTGESLPVDVKAGDTVLSGSINGDRILELKVLRKFSDSTISKIIDMVEHANAKKSKAEKFMSKFAKYYTPIVVGFAVLVGFIFPLFLGNFLLWFERAILFLVISCPCALVISIPLTFFHSIGKASKHGILIKGANYLEALSNIKNIVFDKTGTLTKAKFQIEKIVGNDIKLVKELAKAGEFYSKHPIGIAIYENISFPIEEKDIKNYRNITGYGVSLEYKGKNIFLGKETYLMEQNIAHPEVKEKGSVIFITQEQEYQGYIVVQDQIKKEAPETISQLQTLGFSPYILTGDGKEIAETVGQSLGIASKHIFSNLLPEQKVESLQKIQQSGKTLYIGDGINDAPVLALSDIGISMGSMGSDVAIEASDIVFMDDHIEKLLFLFQLAKENKKTLWTCISFALGVKILVMILGVFGIANMWFAIFADVGVTLLCILYSAFSFRRY
ncbi:cadmium-translocating P-type ATPase, partial [Fusobacterium necrophorum]|nr:cadmium-translocating P-type ATPase [Fusobacterium necrophorum]